jgi:tRNA/tmRNA/rRNA uracil-C5-methylase (TrmA/RlmC/RlmD family)
VEIVQSRVESALKKYVAADVVILDPPRAGAGAAVVTAVSKLKPRAIVYVACDPAALARDTLYLKEAGFKLEKVRAFDLFPMTSHMECVARFISEKP